MVVDVDEAVEQRLQVGQRGGLNGLGGQPLLQRLLESLYLAAGGGVVRPAVLLHHAEAAQFGFERVAAAFPAGVAGRINHPLSVNVEAGMPCWAAVSPNAATTIGPVTRRCAVTDRA